MGTPAFAQAPKFRRGRFPIVSSTLLPRAPSGNRSCARNCNRFTVPPSSALDHFGPSAASADPEAIGQDHALEQDRIDGAAFARPDDHGQRPEALTQRSAAQQNEPLWFVHSLWMGLVFGRSHSRRYRITFAHVRAVLGGSITSGSTEVVDFGSQIGPNNSIRGAVCLSQSFG